MNYLLSENDVKSRISEGCFWAVGSFARFKLQKVHEEDDAGVDYRLIKQILRNDKLSDMGSILDFQVKSTTNWKLDGDEIKYQLRSKNYNDIISRNIEGGTQLILILMCLSKKTDDWIVFNETQINFSSCFYWYHTDSTVLLPNENSSKLIQIPTSNKLTNKTFNELVNNYSIMVSR
ncbi:MAG: DUF4365 domain-containing protein [Deferribacteres bacterium]|nr:DUF4365 domain-containing protein [Deferribacteres bacterium]